MITQLRVVLKSWWMRLLLILVALSFVISFGVGSFSNPTQAVARVDGDPILVDEYQNAYREQLERLRESVGEDAEKTAEQLRLRHLVLQRMINHRLLLHEAERRNLIVTNAQLSEYIKDIQLFQQSGEFKLDLYQRFLASNRIQPADYEERIREDLLVTQLTDTLSQAVLVGDWEVDNVYRTRNEQVRIQLSPVNYKNFKPPKDPDEKAIKSHYESRSYEYMQPAAVKLSYFVLSLADMRAELRVPERLIKRKYEREIESYTTEGSVRARHILFHLLPASKKGDNDYDKATKSLEDIALKVSKGASFAKLARKHSQGPSKDKGGDLGYFKTGDMVPAFSAAAFALSAGEVSKIVRSPFGLHLIQAVDVKPDKVKSFKSVKADIEEQLLLKLAERRLNRELLNLTDSIEEKGLAAIAKELKKSVRKTGWLLGDENKAGLGRVDELVAETIKKKATEIGVLRRNSVQGHVFYQVLAVRDAKLRPLKDVKDEIKAKVIDIKWRQSSVNKARKGVRTVKTTKEWNKLLKKYQAKAKIVVLTLSNQKDLDPSVARRALVLTKKDPYAVVESQGIWMLRLLSRKVPKGKADRKEKEELRAELKEALINAVEASEIDRLRNLADIESPEDKVRF